MEYIINMAVIQVMYYSAYTLHTLRYVLSGTYCRHFCRISGDRYLDLILYLL